MRHLVVSGATTRLGAYGLHLPDLTEAREWMVPVGAEAPDFTVSWEPAGPDRRESVLDGEQADIKLIGGSRLVMRREVVGVRFRGPRRPARADLLHPWLAPAAAMWWQWGGGLPMHAGVWDTPRGAVLLLADKEGGKTTTLSWLARQGFSVGADDLAVVVSGRVLSGPTLLDLRAGAGGRDATSRSAVAVRDGDRLRVSVRGPGVDRPLHGVALLAWSAEPELRVVPPHRRLELLRPHRMMRPLPPRSGPLLDLLARPTVVVGRPRGQDGLRQAGQALVDYFAA